MDSCSSRRHGLSRSAPRVRPPLGGGWPGSRRHRIRGAWLPAGGQDHLVHQRAFDLAFIATGFSSTTFDFSHRGSKFPWFSACQRPSQPLSRTGAGAGKTILFAAPRRCYVVISCGTLAIGPDKSGPLLERLRAEYGTEWEIHVFRHGVRPWTLYPRRGQSVDRPAVVIPSASGDFTGEAHTVGEVRLMGHSLGGLLLQMAYCTASGWVVIPLQARPVAGHPRFAAWSWWAHPTRSSPPEGCRSRPV